RIIWGHNLTQLIQNWAPDDPSKTLCSGTPRLAKDSNYASAILAAWKDDVDNRSNDAVTSVAAPIVYHDDEGCPLFGYVHRPANTVQNNFNLKNNHLPGIILFHTGAGPQDVFLRWKADVLVTDSHTFPDGVVVLIADILGDETGWAWDTDRSRYESVATYLLKPDENGNRVLLQSRVRAALDALVDQPGVDPKRVGVLGFCLGGHPILELGRMAKECVRAMVSFHGVFGSVHKMKTHAYQRKEFEFKDDGKKEPCHVLMCTGKEDPFVTHADLTTAQAMFETMGYKVAVMQYDDTRHGFTNPAQAYNSNPAFGYNPESSGLAWEAMRCLLKSSLNANDIF
ncbi:hypothetical protein ACHAWX_002362, partial [Stephanocyclus meneghinianus]